MPKRHAQILFPLNVEGPFDYAVPLGMSLRKGDFVYAPIGRQSKLGVVWGLSDEAQTDKALKDVLERKPARALTPEMVSFVNWVAKYNTAPLGMVLRMVMRSYKALEPSPIVTRYQVLGDTPPQALSPARTKVMALARNAPELWPGRAGDLAKQAGVSPSVIPGMAKSGLLQALKEPLDPPFDIPDPAYANHIVLTPRQQKAVNELSASFDHSGFAVALIDGVTGSGKTEVYLEAIAAALRRGQQVLVLAPEIALTQAGLDRFGQRFNAEPAQWHSAMGDAARRRVWREVANGGAKLVVGARSALFLPFSDLGLIVVDEEHDTSYKQDEGVIYNARDMAVMRGKIAGAKVVLASATPSLESLNNAYSGRYTHIVLPERPGASVLPDIQLVDLKDDKPAPGQFLSQSLIDGMTDALGRGEQALLYLNRRGYAPLIICRACGERLKSPDTDSWLVEHRRTGRAVCHYTGYSMPMPSTCPACKTEGSLTPVGPGVERVAEEARGLYPEKHVEILSSDTAGNPERIRDVMQRMQDGEIDILVGTQMVVKGHNFPNLTFVGVVDGDLGLMGGDLRAGERTYQTLVQVAGRAGRAERPGRALIQTHLPQHDALSALARGDRAGFISAEMQMRKVLGLPPFGRLAAIIISAPDAYSADQYAKIVTKAAPRARNIEIMGPAEAPIGILRGRHRRRLLIKAAADVDLSRYMNAWKSRLRPPGKIKITVDIDPQNFL